MTTGADVSPVYSPWQGLARALQGGIGGAVAGFADKQEKDQDANNIDVLTKASTATTPEDIAKALKGIKGNSDTVIPVLGQIIQSRLDQAITQQKAGTALSPYNIGSGQIPGAPQGNGGTSITITPGQQQPGTVPQPPSGGADNNIMNIRQSSIPWQGKGSPQNGFETFATPQAGANAAVQNFAAYVKENPNITVAQAFAKWAPAGDGNNNPNAYISRVSETTGINPGMRLADVMQNPVDMARLMEAGTGVEKGRMPAGVTPDVLVNASGGGQPQQAPQPQMAQAQPQGQPAPQQGSPAGGQLRQQAQRAMAMGDNVTALKFAQQATEEDAKWATEQGKIQLQGQEHDRQQATATPNNEQSLSATFADRMSQSNAIIDKLGPALANFKDRTIDSKVLGVGVPGSNYLVSAEYQQARQARDDFINAQLRRESGAAIAASEYENADKQYFPQPGDSKETLAQKTINRQLAVQGMVRGSGPTYQPRQPTVPSAPQGGGGDLVSQAKDAIAKGAPRDKVIERLRAQGINADGL